MEFDFSLFFLALGLAYMLEALPIILSPERMQKVLSEFVNSPAERFRIVGISGLCMGMIFLAIGKYLR